MSDQSQGDKLRAFLDNNGSSLWALLDALPVTGDGVQILPAMKLYSQSGEVVTVGALHFCVFLDLRDSDKRLLSSSKYEWTPGVDLWYSTPEEAKAAKEKK